MGFEIVGQITQVEVIAIGNSIRELPRLRRIYGEGRWRKLKGITTVRLDDSMIYRAEVHWHKAHGIGKYEMKIKEIFDDSEKNR